MQALATIAVECDIAVTEERFYEVIHPWFLKSAPFAGLAAERCGACNLLLEEIRDVCGDIVR
jgi:hypothetical protein